jgi:hypothetical protein
MDPHSFEKLDPDPHSPKKLDTDPHKVNADPKHCIGDWELILFGPGSPLVRMSVLMWHLSSVFFVAIVLFLFHPSCEVLPVPRLNSRGCTKLLAMVWEAVPCPRLSEAEKFQPVAMSIVRYSILILWCSLYN